MLIAKMAFRNIFRRKRRSLLTGIMMAGSFTLFSVSFGFVDGGYGMIIDMFTSDRTGHVQIHAEGYLDKPSLLKRIRDVDTAAEVLRTSPDVRAWAPRVYGPGLAFAGQKTSGLMLMGVSPSMEPEVTLLANKLGKGRFLSDNPGGAEIVLPARTARVLKVEIGDEVALISQAADGSIANELFRVVGTLREDDGSYAGATAFTHIRTAQEFYVLGDSAHEIVIRLDHHKLSRQAAEAINSRLPKGLDAEPWQVVESQFYKAMQADLKGNWITLGVITLIVAVGVLNTVLMVILERTREYGILKAIGTSPGQIFSLIVIETMILATMSIVVGTAGGLATNYYFSIKGITYPEPIVWGGILIEHMKASISARSIWLPTVVIWCTAFVVSLWPAVRAARVVPVKALREG